MRRRGQKCSHSRSSNNQTCDLAASLSPHYHVNSTGLQIADGRFFFERNAVQSKFRRTERKSIQNQRKSLNFEGNTCTLSLDTVVNNSLRIIEKGKQNFSSKDWHLFCPVPSQDPGTEAIFGPCPGTIILLLSRRKVYSPPISRSDFTSADQ